MNFNWQTNLLFPLFSGGGPNGNDSDYGGAPLYHQDAFLAVQNGINHQFVKTIFELSQDVDDEFYLPKVVMQRFPYPPYDYDLLQSAMQILISMFIMLGFLYTMMRVIQFIAVEQEKELKDVMAIMGMPFVLHIACWFLHIMAIMIISITLMIGILKVKSMRNMCFILKLIRF